MTELLSARNPMVERARRLLRDRKEREAAGAAVLEGVRVAEEALRADLTLEYALYAAPLLETDRGRSLFAELQKRRVTLFEVADETLDRTADTRTPQGVLAVFRPKTWDLTDVAPGLVVLLDNVQDPGNIGTIIRSVEAMGGAGLVVCGGVDPYNPKVVRSAMGSLFRLPVVKAELEGALVHLKGQNRRLFVADAGGALTPWQADLTGSCVLVIGNEGSGPSDAARKAAGGVISIPMPGPTESLNAGVATSLLLYEAMRQRLVP